jgi:hypothetical protein
MLHAVLGKSMGHGGTGGPVRPHAQCTAERRQHTCSAPLPRQRIGSEIVAIRCICSDELKYKYGRGIYIDMRYGYHLL